MNVVLPAAADFDVQRIRRDFPILSQTVRGKPLVFLDSGASAQKPRAVIEAMVRCMETGYANVHRWEQTDDVLQNAVIRLHRTLEQLSVTTAHDFFRLAALHIRRERRWRASSTPPIRGRSSSPATAPRR